MEIKRSSLTIKICICLILAFNISFMDPPAGVPAEDTARLISLDYKGADLSSVLKSLSYSYNLNLVVTKEISGKVTISLKDVTVEEALNAVLSVNGYIFTRKGNLIYITSGPGLEGIDMDTVTVPVKYQPAEDAAGLLVNTISAKGDIRVNTMTNTLVVTDYPSSIEKLKSALKDIDVPPTQVLIEAKLVDVTDTDYLNYGVTYTVDFEPGSKTETGSHAKIAAGQTMAGPSTSLSGGQLKLTAFTIKNFADATLTVDALLQGNKGKLLASPSIATLNGQEARIIIGERYPYKEKTQTTTGTTETTKFVDIGTTLRVTPQVSPDGWITMVIHPEVSSVYAAIDDGPRITTREADATIRVRDGETIVIGGLIKRQRDNVRSRVPILGDIPILGMLFTKASSDETTTELVVFITPHIMRSPEETKEIELTRRKEVRVNIEATGERVEVARIWQEAEELERNRGILSHDKNRKARLSTALDLYKNIASQYPGSDEADNALYRAGLIAYKDFGDLALSRKLFSNLVNCYPESPFKGRAESRVKHIDRRLADIKKREEAIARKKLRIKNRKGFFPIRFN